MTFKLPEARSPLAERSTILPKPGTLEHKLKLGIGKTLKIFASIDPSVGEEFCRRLDAMSELTANTELLDASMLDASLAYVFELRDRIADQAQQRFTRQGRVTLADPTRQTGKRDYLVPINDRPVYAEALNDFAQLQPGVQVNPNSPQEFRQAVSLLISGRIDHIGNELIWLGRDSGVIQVQGETKIVSNRKLAINPRALAILDSVRALSDVIDKCTSDPTSVFYNYQHSKAHTRAVIIDALTVSLANRLAIVHEVCQPDAKPAKRTRILGSQAVESSSENARDLANKEPEDDRVRQEPKPDVEICFDGTKKTVINSRWHTTPQVVDTRKVTYGDQTITIVCDYDPALSHIANTTRQKHTQGKGKQHPLDKIMLLEARAYLTKANPLIYDGSGTAKTISARDRTPAYSGLEIRYNGNIRSSSVLRVYYRVAEQSEIFDEPDNPSAVCLVVYAEADKDAEPVVLKHITGRDTQSLRRGM